MPAGTVDTDAEQALAERYGIASVPLVMALRDGIVVCAEPGILSAAALDNPIEDIRALDMDEVRARISA